MTREEAIELLDDLDGAIEDNHGRDYDEAFRMAIEALQAKTDGDLISRQDAIDALGEEPDIWNDTEDEWAYRNAWVEHISAIKSIPSATCDDCIWHVCNYNKIDWDGEDGYISRKDALKPFCVAPDGTRIPEVDCDNFPVEFSVGFIKKHLLSLPSATETVDCSGFIKWILDEIMDEENWELNAVANGEIIARKLKKLGLLEVKDGYYVRTPSAEAEYDWIPCSEKLPSEKDRQILVTIRGEVRVAMYSEFSCTWYLGEMCAVGNEDPIAWMPLPEPYREDGEADETD